MGRRARQATLTVSRLIGLDAPCARRTRADELSSASAERKASAGQVPLLPAQLTPGSNGLPNSYPFPGAPGTPGTPIGANAARRGGGVGPSRLANVAYASPAPGTPQSVAPAPGGHHGQHHGQQGQQPNLAFLQQQQQMQQAQLRLAQQQAQHLAQQQLASQAQMAQLQAAQAHGGGGAGGMSHQMAQHGAALAAHLAASGNKRKRGDEDSRKATEEVEGEVEGEDLTPYCFCQRPSFGEVRSRIFFAVRVLACSVARSRLSGREQGHSPRSLTLSQMIGCDAPDCKIEWFHLNCIGLKESPEGSWYCSQCEPRMKAQGRGGRKR